METNIRPATRADIAGMISLLQLLFAVEADFVFVAERQRQGLELLLGSDRAMVLVAEDQGAVVGMATAQLLISTAEGAPALGIEDLVVTDARQKQGIGSALLAKLAEWGEGLGADRMQLLADQTNSQALNFYRQQGWRQTRLICLRKYYKGENTV